MKRAKRAETNGGKKIATIMSLPARESDPLEEAESRMGDNEPNTSKNVKKSENTYTVGNFETVYVSLPIDSGYYEIQRSKNTEEPSPKILESKNNQTQSSLCRLCATRSKDIFHLFVPNNLYKNIVDKIHLCLPIMVKRDDELPQEACRNCLDKLEICYQFHNSVAEADRELILLNKEEKADTTEDGMKEQTCKTRPQESCEKYDSNNEEITRKMDIITKTDEIELSDLDIDDNFEKDLNRGENFNEERISASENNYPCSAAEEIFENKADWKKHKEKHSESEKIEKSIKPVAESSVESDDGFISNLKLRFNKICDQPVAKPRLVPMEQPKIQRKRPFVKRKNANQRKISANQKKDPAVSCKLCKRRFHASVLEMHIKTCFTQKPGTSKQYYSCEYCGKDEYSHQRVENRSRSFKCCLCNCSYLQISDLRNHCRDH